MRRVIGEFERLMSVEDAGVWKPARGPYEYAGTDLWRRRARHAACSRASLGRRRRRPRRDADGVIDRSGGPYPSYFTAPEITADGIVDLAARLAGAAGP
jgi:2-haloacid dehalogenase